MDIMRQPVFQRLAARMEAALELSGFRPSGAVPRSLLLEEIATSTALAGAHFESGAATMLIEREIVNGTHRLADCIAVADYARAAQYVRDAPQAGRRRPFLRTEELVELHARATRRIPEARPGLWRDTTIRAFPSGMVAPPPWLIPREIETLVERVAGGPIPGSPAILWVAQAHERFERIHPFTAANGRAGRLVANLLLRRCGLPPLVIRPRIAARYLGALHRADSGDPWPLAGLFAQSILDTLTALAPHASPEELGEIPRFATGSRTAALYKAAQRGRLRTVRRHGRLLTTQRWIEEYLASRGVRS